MSDPVLFAFVAAGSYVSGSVPFAYLVGRVFFKIDIREHGSGNVGATNVLRVMGAWPALAVAVLDVAKGFLPVALAGWVSPERLGDWPMIVASMTAVLGHTYTPFLAFRGGKGVATAAGALLRLTPWSVAVLLPVFVVVVALSRLVSLGSVIIAAAYPVSVLVFYTGRDETLGFAVLAAALVLWRHHGNIRRIFAGEEKRITVGRRSAEPKQQEHGEEPA